MGPSDIALLCVLVVLLLFSAFFSSAETALKEKAGYEPGKDLELLLRKKIRKLLF